MDDITRLRGATVYSSDREKIGSVEDVYLDVETQRPEWIALGAGVFSTKHVVVPIADATFEEDGVIVPFTKDRVKDAPEVEPEAISHRQEGELRSFYGLTAERRTVEPNEYIYRRWDWERGAY
jgi:sporulation protein YlmC with PRC-barrel domain